MSHRFNDELKAAIAHHSSSRLNEAAHGYQRALAVGLEEGTATDICFSNYGALLKEQGKALDAALVYRLGERYFPDSLALLRNHANLLFEEGLTQQALARYLRAEHNLGSAPKPGKLAAIHRQQASALVDLGFPSLALSLLEPILADPNAEGQSGLRLGMAELYLQIGDHDRALSLCEDVLSTAQPGLGEAFQQCNLLLQFSRYEEAISRFDDALSIHQRRLTELDAKTKTKFHSTSWNFALALLRRGLLQRGWQLYEHGRWVPNGRGGMQRTVFKLHPVSTLPEWSGENLKGHRLLINGEQGIGDVMMFTSLIPSLIKEADHIGILTYDRLTPIYQRSFPNCTIYDTNDFKQRKIPSDQWTLQTPIGSIPSYRFQSLQAYDDLEPFLVPDLAQAREFASRFASDKRPIIGFSWRGGGNAKQKRTKSLRLEDFLPLFQIPGYRWISLQYGNVNDDVRRFSQEHQLELLTADDVDPLKNMDRWLSLVSCCDYVVSAANTTIHGSGSIGIPTTVILGRDPDWRWLGEPTAPCYWYPKVHIARQVELNSWDRPIKEVRDRLDSLSLSHAKVNEVSSFM